MEGRRCDVTSLVWKQKGRGKNNKDQHAAMSSAGAGCGLQTRRRVGLAAVRFGLRGVPSLPRSPRRPPDTGVMTSKRDMTGVSDTHVDAYLTLPSFPG